MHNVSSIQFGATISTERTARVSLIFLSLPLFRGVRLLFFIIPARFDKQKVAAWWNSSELHFKLKCLDAA